MPSRSSTERSSATKNGISAVFTRSRTGDTFTAHVIQNPGSTRRYGRLGHPFRCYRSNPSVNVYDSESPYETLVLAPLTAEQIMSIDIHNPRHISEIFLGGRWMLTVLFPLNRDADPISYNNPYSVLLQWTRD